MCLDRLRAYQDWGLMALRIAVGAVFIFHGTEKLAMWSSPPDGMSAALFKTLAIAESLGGFAIFVGLLTRWAALGLTIIMIGALYSVLSWGIPFEGVKGAGWEFNLVLLGSTLFLLTSGGGGLSVDGVMRR